jgi:hypothetical protein
MKRNFAVLTLAYLLGCATLVTSCKKNKPAPGAGGTPPLTTQDNTENLTGKNWMMTAATVDLAIQSGTTIISNLYAHMADCKKMT